MKIFFASHFKSQLKKLISKYPHVKEDLLNELDHLNIENEIHIGHSIYKIRIKSSDMKKGKSGGYRCYIYFYIKNELLVPLCIYAKNQQENISENELRYHFDAITEDLSHA
ncbi:MAG: hypothetical protein ACD_51C00025G0002 [uncultured bacterium]|nr:MAG: hypothetical protein ACD_51C00025G0002 [uncultured bacterium]OGJ48289.1 MAG: hypothetical protein A2244_02115 [Candidatus Peregrinibacteria bacterium RIFOXYA2_FULL_41_18]OGJ48888.1 MAG: hypothetical protein A2344_02990 [Candidatus Peregrinibacteria bacterium RIFOXYB12_FULL_41_12]OGJ51538.1 MAG: hypothetical protein A2336_03580 [Candidatus Peregrinibacteria bacterium RIFOXYB2_FULL_41_88]